MDPRMRAALLASLTLASMPAFATTVRHLDLKEIVGASDTIVQGRVKSMRSFWQGKQIHTEVRIKVSRALKGARGDRLTFLQAGEGPHSHRRREPGPGLERRRPAERLSLFLDFPARGPGQA